MIINKIKIDSFKSFYEPCEIDFNNIKGLWKIAGPVGAGKTTIGEAILFGLFGSVSGKNLTDLVPWGKKKANVEIWCISNGHNIYISREISHLGFSSIYVEVDGEELIFTNKRDAQSQLEKEYYDVSKVTMELLCIISFNNFKSLATLNTADTKKFLDQVLGFYVLTQYSDVCKEFKSENYANMIAKDRVIGNLNSQINKLNELSNTSIIEDNIDEITKAINELKDKIHSEESNYNEEEKILSKKENELRAEATKIKTLGTAKAKEISFIEKGICPTCGAAIDQSQLHIKKQEREVLLKQYNTVTENINAVIEERNKLKLEYNNTIAPYKAEIEVNKEKAIRLKEQTKNKDISIQEINRLKKEKESAQAEYDKYVANDLLWERLNSILSNDVRTKILESFIPTLNKNIMDYAQQLHQPYIVKFDNQFKCSVSLCGFVEDVPISSLSTGQLKTVDMMIILGVLGTIIGTASTNVIFLDELFSNLDGYLRNDMCSVLKKFIKPNDTMFIISHQDLDDRWFDGTIKLKHEKKGQYEMHSTINVNSYIKE
jgi:DNA repair exonuclease SbcCD ATPase subunit